MLIKIFEVLQLIISLLTVFVLYQANLFPDMYLIAIALSLLIALLLLVICHIYKKKKMGIIGSILVILICLGCMSVVKKINSTLKEVTTINQKFHDDYVICSFDKENMTDVQSIGNINSKEILDLFVDEIDENCIVKEYLDLFSVARGLKNQEVDAIVIEEKQIDLLTDFDYPNILARAIYDYEQEPVDVKEINDITTESFIIYISDSYNNSQSDVNILAVINPITKNILLLTTPQAIYLENPAGYQLLDKLSYLSLYGLQNSIDGLEQFYNIDIHGYIQINFDELDKLIDALGGITIYSDKSFTTSKYGYYIKEGENHVEGPQAIAFADEEKKNHDQVVTALINELTNSTVLFTNYKEVLDGFSAAITTDLSLDQIQSFIKMQLSDQTKWNIVSYTLTGTETTATTHTTPETECTIIEPDEKSLELAKEQIQSVLTSETISSN